MLEKCSCGRDVHVRGMFVFECVGTLEVTVFERCSYS